MEHILYWLWLTTKYGISPSKINVLLEYFKTVEEIYFSKNFNNIHGLNDKIKSSLADKDLSKAEKILEQTAKLNQKILVYDNENYPNILKNISSPPYVLYVQGKVLELDKVLTIGVVGTRNSSEYGRVVTDRICRELAQYGAVTVGGLARGIDTVGAWATLNAGGVAVGVVGSGLDIVYPSENVELVKAITEKGCIISEYAPGTPPIRNHFPARNRIIAGLSRGILVTEAPEKSGALITAKYALENDRDVFAVPRNITDTNFLGTNKIIQQGAKLINGATDIINEYPYAEKVAPKTVKNSNTNPPIQKTVDESKYSKLNEFEKQIIDILKKSDMQIDELSREMKRNVSEINTKLIMLEVKGLVKKLPGSKYQLKL